MIAPRHVESLLLLEARLAAGESDAEIVDGAWDFAQINRRYAHHLEVLKRCPTDNIGYPKWFTVGAVGRRIPPAAPAVNNFAAARASRDFGWHLWII